MKARCITSVFVLFVFGVGCSLATAAGDSGGGSDAFVVKRALIANQLYGCHSDDVNALLVLFDNMHSEESDRILASLGSYYFGEAAGELYECVVLRKGKEMRRYLRSELASNECAKRYGRIHAALCMNSKDFTSYMSSILSQLDRGQICRGEYDPVEFARGRPLP
jgi:hypothetical protein